MEFDNELLFKNIAHLLQEKDMRTGKFETDCGVKPGYISRMSKDSSTKPGIDFIMKAADTFGVSIDCILKTDMSVLNPTEQYLAAFFDKLLMDTEKRRLAWECEHDDRLNSMEADVNGNVCHPLFSLEEFNEPGESEYPNYVERVIFKSETYSFNTYIDGDSYNLRLKNGVLLYLMSIKKFCSKISELDNSNVCEVWIYHPAGAVQYLASSVAVCPLAQNVKALYEAVKEYNRCPKINQSFEHAIDAFMQDDLSDDPEDW